MANETVILCTTRLDAELKANIINACGQAKVNYVLWDGVEDIGQNASLAPNLLVAPLPAGERRIPEELTQFTTKVFPALPLLVLCNEPLVRNTVTLKNGRITLLGMPLTIEKISGRIRSTLAPKPVVSSAIATAAVSASQAASPAAASSPSASTSSRYLATESRQITSGLRAREYRSPHWWAVSISCRKAQRPVDADTVFPFLSHSPSKGFAAVVPFSPDEVPPVATFERLVENFNTATADTLTQALGPELRDKSAALWLGPNQQWLFFVPPKGVSAWLISPMRLPTVWDLPAAAARGDAPIRRMPAASGDLAIMFADPSNHLAGKFPKLREELLHAAENGGPSVLDFLESRLQDAGPDFAAVIAEVR